MAPFPASLSRPGHGTIVTSVSSPLPVLSTLAYTYPLKLISPSPTVYAKCVLVFLLTYGGGLVSGDKTSLSVFIAASSKLALVTQGTTKIFKALDRATITTQRLDVTIEEDGALMYLPDPVQPFEESVYEQTQLFRLDTERGSLCMLDWISEGRTARGERWKLWTWKGRNEIWSLPETVDDGIGRPGMLILRDNVVLSGHDGTVFTESLEKRMDGLGVFGTFILRGRLFNNLGRFFMEEFSLLPRLGARDWSYSAHERQLSPLQQWREARHASEKNDGVLWTASSVRGCTVVKFGALKVEGARSWLAEMIRKEGTVEREFGEGSLHCLK